MQSLLAAVLAVLAALSSLQEPADPLLLLCTPAQDWASERERIDRQVADLSIDVTWSKVPWKTCLLEAYEQARREEKPVLIWALAGDPEGRC